VHSGPISLEQAEQVMVQRKIKKLPLVDDKGVLTGLITAKDIIEQKRLPLATRDAQGRLRVGAAIGAKGDYLERAAELIRAGVDVLVIDIAHGHSVVMAKALEAFRAKFGDFELVAGMRDCRWRHVSCRAGVNGIKVGSAPAAAARHGSTPTRRAAAARARRCRLAVGNRVPLIADGGIKRDGAIIEALLFGGDTVMLGNAFAGTAETPGETVHKSVVLPESQKVVRVPFKVFRGMASIGAMVDRLDVETPIRSMSIRSGPLEVSVCCTLARPITPAC
jgi:IMP dehydrogenase